jgi:hypothetical protein
MTSVVVGKDGEVKQSALSIQPADTRPRNTFEHRGTGVIGGNKILKNPPLPPFLRVSQAFVVPAISFKGRVLIAECGMLTAIK